ncbi:MAG TPA: sec-independent translocase [Cryptosporangiaceae bacterium]|nr:sec-independent translocase [Cryptosporangiaceae bacterium]
MFENLGWMEITVLALLGLFVFGPERLPKLIGDAARMLRTVRQMARNASSDLRQDLGTDIDLADLNPKTFVRRHLLSEEEEEAVRRPLRDAVREMEELDHVDAVASAHRGGGSRSSAGAARYDTDAT